MTGLRTYTHIGILALAVTVGSSLGRTEGAAITTTAWRLAQTPSLETLSQFGGSASAVDNSSARLAAGVGTNLVVLEAGIQPTALAHVAFRDIVRDVVNLGPYVLVAAGSDGFHIVDASIPSLPRVAASLGLPAPAVRVFAEPSGGDRPYAYVVDTSGAIHVILMADPLSPRVVATVPGSAVDVVVQRYTASAYYAFVADGADGIRVLDVTDPTIWTAIFSTGPLLGPALGVLWYSGFHLYVPMGSAGLLLLDVTTPDAPRELGHSSVETWDVAVERGAVFVAAGENGVFALREGPGLSVIDQDVNIEGSVLRVSVHNGLVVSANGSGGVRLAEAMGGQNDLTLAWRGTYDEPGSARALAVVSDTLLVADAGGHLWSVNVADPRAPDISDDPTRRSTPLSLGGGMAIGAGWIYVADGDTGIRVGRVDNLATLDVVPGLDVGSAKSLALRGRDLFVAAGSDGVYLVDVRDPTSPQTVHLTDTRGEAESIELDGSFAYVADGSGGLSVLDLSDPGVPVVATLDIPGYVLSLALNRRTQTLFTANMLGGVATIDIANPVSPVLLSDHQIVTDAWDLALDSDRLYVAAGSDGLVVVDLLQPRLPVVGAIPSAGEVRAVKVTRGLVFLSDFAAGVRILTAAEDRAPTATATATASATSTGTPQPTSSPTPRVPIAQSIYFPLVLPEHCPPVHVGTDVVIVLDASTSMLEVAASGRSKFEVAVDAARGFVEGVSLENGWSQIGLVTFNETAYLISGLTSDRRSLHEALDQASPILLQSRVELGLYRATGELLGPRHRSGNTQAILLLSDGKANPVPGEAAITAAAQAKDSLILVFVVGLGPSMDEVTLRRIASGEARFRAAANADELLPLFQQLVRHVICPPEAYWARR